MSKFWDNWATKHRNWEVIATAVGVLAILAWGIVQMDSAEMVGSSEVTATVKEIRAIGAASTQNALGSPNSQGANTNFRLGVLVLEDGSTIQMLLVKPLPRPGEKIPLRVEHYDDGSRSYGIDRVKWQIQDSE
jgi:hypothetical protein